MRTLFFIPLILQLANLLAQEVTRDKALGEVSPAPAPAETAPAQPAEAAPVDPSTIPPIGPVDPVDPVILCNYSDPALCARDRSCYWDWTLKCSNKLNCATVPLTRCDFTKPCVLNSATNGYCSGPPKHCNSYTLTQCIHDPFCLWQNSYKCIPKDPQPAIPNCSAMNPIQCKKNAQFCNLNGACYDNPNFCPALNYLQCIRDPACNYTITQKEKCLNNPKFCANLSQIECLKNSKYCLGLSTIPQCVNQFNCSGLNYDQCKQNFKYCHNVQTPFTCKQRVNCSAITDPERCKLAGCRGDSNTTGLFVCSNPVPCDQFDEEKCKANQNLCVYTPGNFTCQNNVECAGLNSAECKANAICHLIPSQFKCIGKKVNCPALQGAQCKLNPLCTYVPQKGFCSQDQSFGCQNLSLQQCFNNKHCLTKYECTNKKIPNCNNLSPDQCKQNALFCSLIQKGHCTDKSFGCDLPYEKCILTRPCLWHPGTNATCTSSLDCSKMTADECKQNDVFCLNQQVGQCRLRFRRYDELDDVIDSNL